MSKNIYENMTSEEKFEAIFKLSGKLFSMTGEPSLHNLRENSKFALRYLQNEDTQER